MSTLRAKHNTVEREKRLMHPGLRSSSPLLQGCCIADGLGKEHAVARGFTTASPGVVAKTLKPYSPVCPVFAPRLPLTMISQISYRIGACQCTESAWHTRSGPALPHRWFVNRRSVGLSLALRA